MVFGHWEKELNQVFCSSLFLLLISDKQAHEDLGQMGQKLRP